MPPLALTPLHNPETPYVRIRRPTWRIISRKNSARLRENPDQICESTSSSGIIGSWQSLQSLVSRA